METEGGRREIEEEKKEVKFGAEGIVKEGKEGARRK